VNKQYRTGDKGMNTSVPLSILTLAVAITCAICGFRRIKWLIIAFLILPFAILFHQQENSETIFRDWCQQAGVTTQEVRSSAYGTSDGGFYQLDIWKVAVGKRYPALQNNKQIEQIATKWMEVSAKKNL
jgi:hypothetical protein